MIRSSGDIFCMGQSTVSVVYGRLGVVVNKCTSFCLIIKTLLNRSTDVVEFIFQTFCVLNIKTTLKGAIARFVGSSGYTARPCRAKREFPQL